jgi:hypothetical protein
VVSHDLLPEFAALSKSTHLWFVSEWNIGEERGMDAGIFTDER